MSQNVVRVRPEKDAQVIVELRGGWKARIFGTEDGTDIRLFNPTDEGGEKFFAVTTRGNPYGAPMVVQEPTLGVPCRNCGVGVDGNIVGALVLNEDGEIVERFSWSNLVFMKDGEFEIDSDGLLTVNGDFEGYLVAVFLPDKNRMQGYIGVFGPNKPESIKILEMEDLLLGSL